MNNSIIYKGGCTCSKVRYEAKREPQVTAVYHWRYCKLRYGNAFEKLLYFKEENLKFVEEKCSVDEFIIESSYQWSNQFYKICAKKLTSRLEVKPGHVGVEGEIYNPPTFWYDIDTEIFTRSKAHFIGNIPIKENLRLLTTIHQNSLKI